MDGSECLPGVVANGLVAYEALQGLAWASLAMDGAMTNAPLGGKQVGKHPTDGGKMRTKRRVLTDGGGVPLASPSRGPSEHLQDGQRRSRAS